MLPEILELRSNAVSQTRPCHSQHDLKQDLSFRRPDPSTIGIQDANALQDDGLAEVKRQSSQAGRLIGLEGMSHKSLDKDANVLWRPVFWFNEAPWLLIVRA
ncbi:hypothetical protein XH93_08945 [Bradyrhizobium sp. CCBAU 51753]|nr:hypothetical protein XH93_08945 [Bradyrhizobium sp. CCBAU 51753]